MILGLFTRLASIPLIVIISIAIVTTKFPMLASNGFWSMAHESRVDFAMLLGCVIFAHRWRRTSVGRCQFTRLENWNEMIVSLMQFCMSSMLFVFRLQSLCCHAAASAPMRLKETAVFAGGCFWGVEAVFEHVKGVNSVVSGYSGGTKETANYETVSTGKTDHAESVMIKFDPAKVTYKQLLVYFLRGCARSDRGRPSGSRRRPPIPLGNFLHNRRAENRGRWHSSMLLTSQKHFQACCDAGRAV